MRWRWHGKRRVYLHLYTVKPIKLVTQNRMLFSKWPSPPSCVVVSEREREREREREMEMEMKRGLPFNASLLGWAMKTVHFMAVSSKSQILLCVITPTQRHFSKNDRARWKNARISDLLWSPYYIHRFHPVSAFTCLYNGGCPTLPMEKIKAWYLGKWTWGCGLKWELVLVRWHLCTTRVSRIFGKLFITNPIPCQRILTEYKG